MRIRYAAALGIVLLVAGCGGQPADDKTGDTKSRFGGALVSMRADEETVVGAIPAPSPAFPEEGEANPADVAIDEYEQLMVKDMDNPENADEMLALANLYLQRRSDFAHAAQWYQEYVNRYGKADNPQAGMIFIQLLTCYEKLGADSDIRATCRQIMRAFPPDRQEYQYADKLLKGEDVSQRTPKRNVEERPTVSEEGNAETSAEPGPAPNELAPGDSRAPSAESSAPVESTAVAEPVPTVEPSPDPTTSAPSPTP